MNIQHMCMHLHVSMQIPVTIGGWKGESIHGTLAESFPACNYHLIFG